MRTVYVTRGHLGGRFVYYDDEEDEDEAIVYVGRPLTSACYTAHRIGRWAAPWYQPKQRNTLPKDAYSVT